MQDRLELFLYTKLFPLSTSASKDNVKIVFRGILGVLWASGYYYTIVPSQIPKLTTWEHPR